MADSKTDKNGRWVTIDGTHVFINGSGEVIKGPAGLEGKPLSAPTTKKKPTSSKNSADKFIRSLPKVSRQEAEDDRQEIGSGQQVKSPIKQCSEEEYNEVSGKESIKGSVSKEETLSANDLLNLLSAQKTISEEHAISKIGKESTDLPVILDDNGKRYIQDGNHTIAAKIANKEGCKVEIKYVKSKLQKAMSDLSGRHGEGLMQSKQKANDTNGHWVTMPNGTHVFIDESGEVAKGPSGLEGKPLDVPAVEKETDYGPVAFLNYNDTSASEAHPLNQAFDEISGQLEEADANNPQEIIRFTDALMDASVVRNREALQYLPDKKAQALNAWMDKNIQKSKKAAKILAAKSTELQEAEKQLSAFEDTEPSNVPLDVEPTREEPDETDFFGDFPEPEEENFANETEYNAAHDEWEKGEEGRTVAFQNAQEEWEIEQEQASEQAQIEHDKLKSKWEKEVDKLRNTTSKLEDKCMELRDRFTDELIHFDVRFADKVLDYVDEHGLLQTGQKAMPEQSGRWVTIDGTHVFINGSGEVIKGPAGLEGKPLSVPKTENNEAKTTPEQSAIPDKQADKNEQGDQLYPEHTIKNFDGQDTKINTYPSNYGKEPGEYYAYRVGSLQTERGAPFFSADRKGAEAYANMHEGHSVIRYKVNVQNPMVAENLYDAYAKVLGKTKQDVYNIRDRQKDVSKWWRSVDKKIIQWAKKKGHDFITYTRPAYPATREIVALDSSKVKTDDQENNKQKAMSYLSETSGGALVAPADQPKSLVFDPEGIKLLRQKYKRRKSPVRNEHAERITNTHLVGITEKSFQHVRINSQIRP